MDNSTPMACASFDKLRRAALLFAIAVIAISLILGREGNLSLFYLHRQDVLLALVGTALILAATIAVRPRERPFIFGWRLGLAISLLMAATAFVGHHQILSGHDMSRDEQMATFDAEIIGSGQLVAPLPERWRDHADALNTSFMREGRMAWKSGYLPVNAAFRTIFAKIASPALAGPFWILLGAIAMWGCVRRIWPDNREAPVVALFLYLGSGQILFNGMTAYAMPAHLALNLCWLWLFLRGRLFSDVAALVLGLVITGLHQIHFHPLFAAPILFLSVLDRDWRRAGLYFLGYAAIGIFWILWSDWQGALMAGGIPLEQASGRTYQQITGALWTSQPDRWPNMATNLIRFVTWQHLLLLPLMAMGLYAARRDRLALALAGGIALTLFVRFTFLPFQGHGIGYRYLHGLLGNCILLGIFGWIALASAQAWWRPLMVRLTIAASAIILPLQAWMVHGFYAPVMQVSEGLDALDADYVVIGALDVPYSSDLVINRPFLQNRPLRLLREKLSPAAQRMICAPHPTLALAGASLLQPISDYYRQAPVPSMTADNRRMANSLRRHGCHILIPVERDR